MATDGDPDPISAGTAGDAALWGGSIAAVGMAANPLGAHQVGRHRVGRTAGRCAPGRDDSGRVRIGDQTGKILPVRHAPSIEYTHSSTLIALFSELPPSGAKAWFVRRSQ